MTSYFWLNAIRLPWSFLLLRKVKKMWPLQAILNTIFCYRCPLCRAQDLDLTFLEFNMINVDPEIEFGDYPTAPGRGLRNWGQELPLPITFTVYIFSGFLPLWVNLRRLFWVVYKLLVPDDGSDVPGYLVIFILYIMNDSSWK